MGGDGELNVTLLSLLMAIQKLPPTGKDTLNLGSQTQGFLLESNEKAKPLHLFYVCQTPRR